MRQLDGTGWLTLSDRPGRWWATVTGSVDYSAWIQGFEDRTATVMFEADPWRYANEPRTEVLTDAGAVQNDGTEAADPEITVTGSGDIVLMIGQQITQLNGVADGVVIDHRPLPVIGGRIEGGNPDKVIYFRVEDDELRGFRIHAGDLLLTVPTATPVDDAIMLIELNGKRAVRKIKKLDGGKLLLQTYDHALRLDTVELKNVLILGRCVRL